MALGGGTWTNQNKKLPGSYINFVSANRAMPTLGERGFAAMPLMLDWGVDGTAFTVTNTDFKKDSLKIFGYDYTHDKMKDLRDLFLNARVLYAYRLGDSTKASCNYGEAACGGTRGNDLKILITAIMDGDSVAGYNVKTMLENTTVDLQNVMLEEGAETATTNSLKNNDFVNWTPSVNLTAGTTAFSGGSNATVATADYSEFLKKIQPYSFNVLGCASTSEPVKALFVDFTKRMREEQGVKFQCVLHKYEKADYEGVISVENNIEGSNEASLVYWVTGASTGCEINKSITNKIYDGEHEINGDYTQDELENSIDAGKFVFHKVGDDMRVLEDINTLINTTTEKSDDFKSNQTIRVLDQIANDIASIFNTKYLGKIPNDNSGRISLWNDIVKHHQELEKIRAIENFASDDVTVEMGDTKKSVIINDAITPTNCMSILYMTVMVN